MKGAPAIRELGPRVRQRREEMGLSIDEVAMATRIPVAHLRAIEQERPQDLPDGPYAAAYLRVVVEHLGIEWTEPPPVEEAVDAHEPRSVRRSGLPLGVVRTLAGASAALVVLTVGVLSWQRFVPERTDVVVLPDQHLTVTARRSGRLVATVDGTVVHDGVLPGGQSIELEGHERLEVTVDSTSSFAFSWNGEAVVPQGLQDHTRTLVFIDDVGP